MPDLRVLADDERRFPIPPSYWDYLLRNLYESGYINGVTILPLPRQPFPGVKVEQNLEITPAGIEYLQENGLMKKAYQYLRDIKELIPHISS